MGHSYIKALQGPVEWGRVPSARVRDTIGDWSMRRDVAGAMWLERGMSLVHYLCIPPCPLFAQCTTTSPPALATASLRPTASASRAGTHSDVSSCDLHLKLYSILFHVPYFIPYNLWNTSFMCVFINTAVLSVR